MSYGTVTEQVVCRIRTAQAARESYKTPYLVAYTDRGRLDLWERVIRMG
jgi:hypothetical protein